MKDERGDSEAEDDVLWTNRDIASHLRVSVRSIDSFEAQGTIPAAHYVIPRGVSGRVFKRWKKRLVLEHLEQHYRRG